MKRRPSKAEVTPEDAPEEGEVEEGELEVVALPETSKRARHSSQESGRRPEEPREDAHW